MKDEQENRKILERVYNILNQEGDGMTEFTFYLSGEDFDRLYEIKHEQGKDELTGNEFAKELLVNELHRLHPAKVDFDE